MPVLHLSLPAKPSLFPTSAGTGINAGAQGIGSVFPLFYGCEIPLQGNSSPQWQLLSKGVFIGSLVHENTFGSKTLLGIFGVHPYTLALSWTWECPSPTPFRTHGISSCYET